MKQYIKDLETMFGTWEEDFKKAIENENPNFEEDFVCILQALPPETIPEYLEWMITIGNANLISRNINAIMQIILNYRGYQKVWISKAINSLKGIQDKGIDESISNNLISIIKGPYSRGNTWVILNFYNICKDIGNSSDIIDKNYGEVLKVIFSQNQYLSNNPDELNKIMALISQIAQQENVRLSDITDVGDGQYNNCMRIGNTILKFGKDRILEDLPAHSRILQPKLRIYFPKKHTEKIEQGTLNSQDLITIECQDVVDSNWDKDLTDEQKKEALYSIYKDLRKAGYIWTDIKSENVGRLLKPNIVKHTEQSISGETLEMQVSLPAGELVIFDTDRIYEKDKLPKFNNMGLLDAPLYEEFEKRYNEEQELMMNSH